MGTEIRKLLVMFTIVLMGTMSLMPVMGSSPAGDTRGPGPMADATPWTDPLDDLSHVYVPSSGLVGIEVSGGNAHLKTGDTRGWLASEIISVPPGYRYDLVLLEVDTPGASTVEVSILDASADPVEIGFANETIGGFKLRTETDLSVFSIGPGMFPDIRIQVNLDADGTHRPRLLSWTLYFIGLDEWRDDFRGTGKMSDFNNINFTGDVLEVNLTSGMTGGGGTGAYDPYPPLANPSGGAVGIFYPNAGNTGYQDHTTVSGSTPYITEFEDLNNDGYIDILVADASAGAMVYWGDSSGTFSPTSKNTISTTTNLRS